MTKVRQAERLGPHARAQRDELFDVLTHAIVSIGTMPAPWLDDAIDRTRKALVELRAAIPPG